jgi:tripartite ATP-independent transporter DctP family solute receptor
MKQYLNCKWVSSIIIIMVAILTIPAVAKSVAIKFGTDFPTVNLQYKTYERFKELIEKKSKGQITVLLYPKGQLGTSEQQIQGMRIGTQDMFSQGFSLLEKEGVPELGVFSVPYFFRNQDHLVKFWRGPMGKRLEGKMVANIGVRNLNNKYTLLMAPRCIISKKPIFYPEDIKGVKLRLFKVKLNLDAWTYLGALPIILPYSEVYMGMKTGVADAVTMPVDHVWANKIGETAKYVSMIYEFWQVAGIWMNEKKFQSFSKDNQTLLIEAANEASDYGATLIKSETNDLLQKLMNEQNCSVIYVNTNVWRNTLQPYIQEQVKNGSISKEIYDATQGIN